MTVREPTWWQFAVLALAAFRIYRLVARDTISEPLRAVLTYPDAESVSLDDGIDRLEVVGDADQPKTWRIYLSTLLRCPWCAGFYVSVAVWVLWDLWPGPVEFAMTPWALSGALALIEKNLDE